MSQSPHKMAGSKRYSDGWRAVNELIRADSSWSGRERNTCYLNQGAGAFGDVSFVTGLDFAGDGRSFVIFDYDHDGDLDLLIKFRTGPQLLLMRNDSPRTRSMVIELEGTAVGARLTLETSDRTLTREVASGSSYLAQHSRRAHFALQADETPRALNITWPGGDSVKIDEPPLGLHRIRPGEPHLTPWNPEKPPPVTAAEEPFEEIHGTWLVEPVPAPDFTLQDLQAGKHSLSTLSGQKVLLTFWATWCPPCRKELSELRDNIAELRREGVEVLAVSVDDPAEQAAVRGVAKEYRLNFPVLFANDQTVAVYTVLNRYLFDRRRDLGIPTSFLINPKGLIVKAYVGETPVESVLADARVMKGSPIPFPGRRITPAPRRNYLDLGTAMAERGLTDVARMMFQSAIASGQQGFQLYTNLGGLLLESGNLDQAEKMLRTSLQLRPDQIEAKINLGTLLLRKGSPTEALQYLTEARKIYPDDPLVLSSLGTAYFQLDQPMESERFFREAVRLVPKSGEYHYNLGASLAALGRRWAAIEAFERSRALGYHTPDLHNSLAILYVETDQHEKAAEEFQHALDADPASLETRLNLALFYIKAGDPAKARPILEKLLDEDPSLAPARQLLKSVK